MMVINQVKDVRVPEQLMRAMAAEAEAARNARAKVTNGHGDHGDEHDWCDDVNDPAHDDNSDGANEYVDDLADENDVQVIAAEGGHKMLI